MRQDQYVQVVVVPTLDQILDFCAEEPVERVFLEDVARRGLGRFAAVETGRRLEALCHMGSNLVPSGRGCAAFADIVRDHAEHVRMVVGEERAVGELWDAPAPILPRPAEDRPGQPVYELETMPPPGDTKLRAAKLRDYELLLPACVQMHREEAGIDPMRRYPDEFRWRTRSQIEEGRSWLWEERGRILFKAEASAWTPRAVQLMQGGSIPRRAAEAMRNAACGTCAASCSRARRASASLSARRTPRRSASMKQSACAAQSRTAP